MNRQNVMEKLQEIIRDVFGDSSLVINESTKADDIDGWDSLTHITIMEAVQDEFGVKFSIDEMIEMHNVGDIASAVMVRVRGEDDTRSKEAEVWNTSYRKGGNILFYPHEEIIRFVNKYVRKRYSIDKFEDKMQLLISHPETFASLDLGCGIGRHVKYLDECGLNPYGIDLSDKAIGLGKQWMKSVERDDLADRLTVASVTEIPFDDDYFSICVSHGVLDSMPREIAVLGMKEVRRVLRADALMYLDLIMDTESREGDEVVDSGYEKDTTQSYFTVATIKEFLSDFEIVDFNIIYNTDDLGILRNKRAHLVIRNTK